MLGYYLSNGVRAMLDHLLMMMTIGAHRHCCYKMVAPIGNVEFPMTDWVELPGADINMTHEQMFAWCEEVPHDWHAIC